MAARFKGIAAPIHSQCLYCRHPEISCKRPGFRDPYRLVLRCRINQYAPLVTWNCPSFEREPGSDDQGIYWNAHLYPVGVHNASSSELGTLSRLGFLSRRWARADPCDSPHADVDTTLRFKRADDGEPPRQYRVIRDDDTPHPADEIPD